MHLLNRLISHKFMLMKLEVPPELPRMLCSAVGKYENNEEVILENETSPEKEAEIESKCNKSRLSEAHRNIVNGKRPYRVPMALVHKTVKYNRKMFGKYGIESGVNPSICWPSLRDINERVEYENVAFPYSIQEMMAAAENKSKMEKQAQIERMEMISAKLEKLDQWKKELEKKKSQKLAESLAAKEKKERLVEEVRRHFGFKLDPRDERFQEMVVKREKEQKKMEKMARKEAKEKQMIAKLQQKNAEITQEQKP